MGELRYGSGGVLNRHDHKPGCCTGSIELPSGKKLATLYEAGQYITILPKVEQEAPEWQTAAAVHMLVVGMAAIR